MRRVAHRSAECVAPYDVFHRHLSVGGLLYARCFIVVNDALIDHRLCLVWRLLAFHEQRATRRGITKRHGTRQLALLHYERIAAECDALRRLTALHRHLLWCENADGSVVARRLVDGLWRIGHAHYGGRHEADDAALRRSRACQVARSHRQ